MSSPSFSFGASPSVSKERWLKHALQKMAKGYNLFVNPERKVANFYKGYGEFESCSYQTARKLINQGFVEHVGDDEMGMVYRLKTDTTLEVTEVPLEEEDEDDDVGVESDEAIDDSDDIIDDDMDDDNENSDSSGYEDTPLFGEEDEDEDKDE